MGTEQLHLKTPKLVMVLFDPEKKLRSKRWIVDYFDEVTESLTVNDEMLARPEWARQPFAARLRAYQAAGKLSDGSYVEILHGHGCPYPRDVPLAERPICTCKPIIFVYGEEEV